MLNSIELKNVILNATENKDPEEVWGSMVRVIEDYINSHAEVKMVFLGTLGQSPSPLNMIHTLNLKVSLNADYIQQTVKTLKFAGLSVALNNQLALAHPEHNVSNMIRILPPYPILTINVLINTYLKKRDQAMLAMASGIVTALKTAIMVPPVLSAPVNVNASGSIGALTFTGIL